MNSLLFLILYLSMVQLKEEVPSNFLKYLNFCYNTISNHTQIYNLDKQYANI
jgi:hypothetical protein